MHKQDALLEQNLYTVTIENVTIGLILDHALKPDEMDSDLTYMTRHQHAYTELFVCLAGQISINTENGDCMLSAGDAVFIPANFMHVKLSDDNDADFCVIGMTFTRRSTKNSTNLYRTLSKFSSRSMLVLRSRPSFCAAVAALMDTSTQNPCLPALRLAMLLAETAEDLQKVDQTDVLSADFHASELDRISLLDYLIDSCFMRPITAAYAADQLCISERQFSRIVRKRFGIPFHEVITNKRLSVATRMLAETTVATSKIAEQIGYQSVSSFYRAFSARYGITPTEYREKQQKT